MSNTHTSTNPYGVAQINPADWKLVGSFYQGDNDDIHSAYANEHEKITVAVGGDWNTIVSHGNGGCASCGSHFNYGAVFTNDGVFIQVGNVCGIDHFNQPDSVSLFRKRATKAAENAKIKRLAIAGAQATLDANDGLEDALNTDHYIVQDIRYKLNQYGNLSDGQIALVFKIAREQAEFQARKDARDAELASTPALAEGRYELTGKVISTKAQDSDYGTQYKQLVELSDGNRVWGTIPSAILDEVWDNDGVTVTFTAAVERSKDDEHFGFYKRPTKPTASFDLPDNGCEGHEPDPDGYTSEQGVTIFCDGTCS